MNYSNIPTREEKSCLHENWTTVQQRTSIRARNETYTDMLASVLLHYYGLQKYRACLVGCQNLVCKCPGEAKKIGYQLVGYKIALPISRRDKVANSWRIWSLPNTG